MKKIILMLLICMNSLFANLFSEDDIKVLKDLGLDSSFSSEPTFLNIFDENSSGSKISYYDSFLRRASLSVQIVRSEIQKEKLPVAVLFIPLIESSFVNQTKGKNSPGGLWQIIPQTAKNLRLQNDDVIDERLDLIKSTDAASSYIKGYYKKLGKWYLAILAYNCGEGRVLEGVTRASLDKYLEENPEKADDISVKNYKFAINNYQKTKAGFSDLYQAYNQIGKNQGYYSFSYLIKNNKKNQYIPDSSLDYIQKVIALAILEQRDAFKNIDRKSKYELEKVKAPKGVQLKSIANAISMDLNEFKSINKQIKKDVFPADSRNYNFYIPHTKLELYNQKLGIMRVVKDTSKDVKVVETKNNNKISVKQKDDKKVIIHIIKKGDTLETIAKQYKTDVKKLKIIGSKKGVLKIGDKVEVHK